MPKLALNEEHDKLRSIRGSIDLAIKVGFNLSGEVQYSSTLNALSSYGIMKRSINGGFEQSTMQTVKDIGRFSTVVILLLLLLLLAQVTYNQVHPLRINYLAS